jgi:hypothetical protein
MLLKPGQSETRLSLASEKDAIFKADLMYQIWRSGFSELLVSGGTVEVAKHYGASMRSLAELVQRLAGGGGGKLKSWTPGETEAEIARLASS